MNKPFKNVLLVHKKSAYAIYFLERKIKLTKGWQANLKKEITRFKLAHDEHFATLKHVEGVLKKHRMPYTKKRRGTKINYGRFDLIITVGGDGSFLQAARSVKDQVMIGVNSALSYSVGKLCVGNIKNFEHIIRKAINGDLKVVRWPRLRVKLEGHSRPIDCINDILIAHSNPAAMTRYYLKVGSIKEEQRNSGLWISTAAGSSGAIKSAGGRMFKPDEKFIQYMPRELCDGFSKNYRLKSGFIKGKQAIIVTSLMRSGKIFIDGTHFKINFPFNTTCRIGLSPHPLKTISL